MRPPAIPIAQIFISLLILQAAASALPFSVTLKTPSKAVRVGEPLVLRATTTNVSDHEIKFARGFGEQEFDFGVEVRDAKGVTPPMTEAFKELKDQSAARWGSYSTYSLEPGKSFDDDINVTKLYEIARPGKYTISVTRGQRPLWETTQTSKKDGVKSNVITITVDSADTNKIPNKVKEQQGTSRSRTLP